MEAYLRKRKQEYFINIYTAKVNILINVLLL